LLLVNSAILAPHDCEHIGTGTQCDVRYSLLSCCSDRLF
jgi:hypothetical protein